MATAALLTRRTVGSCQHEPSCPAADAPDHCAAKAVATHPEQDWTLLCNGVISFHDTGELLPDGTSVGPHRGGGWHVTSTSASEVTHA